MTERAPGHIIVRLSRRGVDHEALIVVIRIHVARIGRDVGRLVQRLLLNVGQEVHRPVWAEGTAMGPDDGIVYANESHIGGSTGDRAANASRIVHILHGAAYGVVRTRRVS